MLQGTVNWLVEPQYLPWLQLALARVLPAASTPTVGVALLSNSVLLPVPMFADSFILWRRSALAGDAQLG